MIGQPGHFGLFATGRTSPTCAGYTRGAAARPCQRTGPWRQAHFSVGWLFEP